MTFLTFFLYYIGSKLLFEGTFFCIFILRKRYAQKKMQEMINSGKLQMINVDDIVNAIQEQEKKTWN